MSRHLRTVLPLAAAVLALPSTTLAGTGRVVHPLGPPIESSSVIDVGRPVPLPDGGTLLVRTVRRDWPTQVAVQELRADGTLAAAAAPLTVPGGAFRVTQALRRPDGRLLVLGTTSDGPMKDHATIVGLTAQGALDGTYGAGGVAALPPTFHLTCDGCGPMALARDGGVVVAGNDNVAVVERVTAAGALDPTFGEGGKAAIPTSSAGGFANSALVQPDGSVVVGASDANGAPWRVTRFRPDGTPDPAWNGGLGVQLPGRGAQVAAAPDEAVLASDGLRVVRLRADGTPDPAYGDGGTVTVTTDQKAAVSFEAVAADGSATLLHGVQADAPNLTGTRAVVHRLDPAGRDTATTLDPGFGGGSASAIPRERGGYPLPSWGQSGLTAFDLLPRAGGGWLLLGSVGVVQYFGEGLATTGGFLAAAALTPELRPDTAYGPTPAAPTVSVGLVPQRAATARARSAVTVRITASAPGLVRVRIRDRAGRSIARADVPVYVAGTSRARVGFASGPTQDRLRPGRVRLSARIRDLFGGTAEAKATAGALR